MTDDGIGFDPALLAGDGVSGMRERAQLLGGVFCIESILGRGTVVGALIPREESE